MSRENLNRVLSVILGVVMVFLSAPFSFAVTTEDEYDIYVAGVQITKSNKDDVLGDGGSVKYNAGVLSLTNANITQAYFSDNASPAGYFGIKSYDELTVKLEGENKIDFSKLSVEDPSTKIVNGICIVFGDRFEITGSGSLKIVTPDGVSDSRGIDNANGTISITGGCVEIYTGDAYNPKGIDAENLYVEGGSTLKVFTGDIKTNGYSRSINCGVSCDSFIVTKNSSVYIENGDIIALTPAEHTYADLNCGIYSQKGVHVSGSSLTALAGKTSGIESVENGKGSYGIYSEYDEVTFENSNLIASGYDFAVKNEYINVNDAEYAGLEFFYSDNVDGSELKKYENTIAQKQFDKPYLVIAPDGTVELPQKSFFEKIADFFRNIFESIVRVFESLF